MPIIGESFTQIPHYLRTVVSDGAYVTYAALLEVAWAPIRADLGGGKYFRTEEALAESRGVSVRTIIRHVRELESVGAITVKRIGKRRPNVITVSPWDHITAQCPDTNDTSPAYDDLTREAPASTSVLTQVAAATCQDWQIHKEEDDSKKTPSLQEDSSPHDLQEHRTLNSVVARDLVEDRPRPAQPASAVGPSGPPSTDSWVERPVGPFSDLGSLQAIWWVDVFELRFTDEYHGDPFTQELREAYASLWKVLGRGVAQREVETICELHPRDLDSALQQMLELLERSA